MLKLLQDCCNCLLLSLIKEYLNKHIIYYNLPFLTEKGFWNTSSLLQNLTYLSLLDSTKVLMKIKLCGLPIFFLHPVVSHVFHGPGFSGPSFFWVQVFYSPGFLGSRFFRARVQVLELSFLNKQEPQSSRSVQLYAFRHLLV